MWLHDTVIKTLEVQVGGPPRPPSGALWSWLPYTPSHLGRGVASTADIARESWVLGQGGGPTCEMSTGD